MNNTTQATGISLFTRRLLANLPTYLPVILFPLIAWNISHDYGQFLWGSFFREFLLIMSLAFVLQTGSNQMLILSPMQADLDTEFRLSVQSRIIIFTCCCFSLLLMPISTGHLIILVSFLLFRVLGDTLTGYHRAAGNDNTNALAESSFWLVFCAGVIYQQSQLSVITLLQTVAIASGVRFIAADPRTFKRIIPLERHAPDGDWFKEAFSRFIPSLSNFTFHTTDVLIAAFMLSVNEFAGYQICVLSILATGMLINTLMNSIGNSRSLQQLITFSALLMIPVALLFKFILQEFAGVELTPWFLLAAWVALNSAIISSYFMKWLMEDREQKFIVRVFLAGTIVYCAFLPWIFNHYELQEYLLFFAGIQMGAAISFAVGSFAKGYR